MNSKFTLKPAAAAVLAGGLALGGSALALKMPWEKDAKPAQVAAPDRLRRKPNAMPPTNLVRRYRLRKTPAGGSAGASIPAERGTAIASVTACS